MVPTLMPYTMKESHTYFLTLPATAGIVVVIYNNQGALDLHSSRSLDDSLPAVRRILLVAVHGLRMRN